MTTQAQSASYRLSLQQARAWALGPGQQRAQIVVSTPDGVDLAAIRSGLDRASRRHEVLRTTYVNPTGLLVGLQVIHEALELPLRSSDAPLDEVASSEFAAPWDPEHDAPLRAVLVGGAALVLTGLAIAIDGHGLAGLAAEILGRAPVEDEPLQLADYAEWQQEVTTGPSAGVGRSFWEARRPAHPIRLPMQAAESPDGAQPAHRVPIEATPMEAVTVAAAFHSWVARVTGETDIAVATLVTGRDDEMAGALGPFARYVPVRTEHESDPGLDDLAAAISATLEAGAPWVEQCPVDDRAQQPVAFADLSGAASEAQRLRVDLAPYVLELIWLGDRAELAYDARAIAPVVAKSFAAQLAALLAAIPAAQGPASALPLVDAGGEQALLEGGTGPVSAPPVDTVVRMFELQADRTPTAEATRCGGDRLTYAELDARANALAHALAARGVDRDGTAGLLVDRSVDLIVGVLGILKAGAAYVPLNPEHPATRMAHQLGETDAAIVVTAGSLAALLPEGTAVLDVRADPDLAAAPTARPASGPGPADLAYVLYTSGSTGVPKGVAVTHANLSNYTVALVERLGAQEGWHYGMVTAISTDLGNTCVFPPLASGGCVDLVPIEVVMDPFAFAEHVAAYPHDVLKITPSHLGALLDAGPERVLPTEVLVLGGEASRWELIERVRAAGVSRRLLNHYGPTETTIGSCTFDLAEDVAGLHPATVPVGRPLTNTTCDVVDRHGRLVPDGVPGELWIGGTGVAIGYIGQPEQTAEHFGEDPHRGAPARVYRTGDRVRRLPGGAIEFLGRIDDQVKIRGHRIEPREVEQVLARHPQVKQVVVVARDDTTGDRHLVAYLVADTVPTLESLRSFVLESLPEYMAPTVYARLNELPYTPSGKIDRRALPEPDSGTRLGGSTYVAPGSPTEEAVAALWADVLGVDKVGVNDDFFEIGGHSLRATQVVARILSQFGVQLALTSIFTSPTVARLAVVIDEHIAALTSDEGELADLLDDLTPEELEALLGDDT